MSHPGFFDTIPHLAVREPLAQFLGASNTGIFDYSYLDAVKLAGHSCPTVASAYWLTCLALKALYDDQMPERGGVSVEFADGYEEGVTGVVASVVTLLTGAAGEGGFAGLNSRFVRRGLMRFNASLPLDLRFSRLDTGAQVDAAAYPGKVPASPELSALMARCIGGEGSPAEQQRFGLLWQERVRRLLGEHRHDPEVFVVHPVG